MDLPEFRAASECYKDIGWTPEKQVLNLNAYLNGKTATEDNITHYQKPDIVKRHQKVTPWRQ
ncbi:hypothetical protein [Halomonas sp. H10-9-1]|uniref:hypothetical protein n=1 Tax=Halomonas sp. H10-9-1 TaxID=2950871 RepID=UPI0032DE6F66